MARITNIKKHPNADTLVIVKVDDLDYQIVAKDIFTLGQEVAFFPIDTVFSEKAAAHYGVKRIKTIKLRGEISQGMIAPIDEFALEPVTKYEDEVVDAGSMTLRGLPDGISVYKIESAQKVKFDFDFIHVTEKLEGTNAIFTNNMACSHRRKVDPGNNLYWRMHEKYNLSRLPDGYILRGEIIGPKVQNNYYGLKENELRAFDIETKEGYLEPFEAELMCEALNVPVVPKIFAGHINAFLLGDTLVNKSNGTSLLVNKLREGIVIKSLFNPRLIAKVRSPEYLCG